jgi:hypothetical protein
MSINKFIVKSSNCVNYAQLWMTGSGGGFKEMLKNDGEWCKTPGNVEGRREGK